MNPAKMSAVLLLLVCAVLTRPAGLVFADEAAATEATTPKVENAESTTAEVGAEVSQTTSAAEAATTAAQTTSTAASVETSSSTTTQATTTTSKATEAPTAASPAAGLGAHDQVQEQAANISTTPKPTTSTPMPTSSTPKASTPVPTTTRKPNDASLGATLSVATLVIGLCLTYL